MTAGTRKFGSRYYMLCGRGTKEQMQREAEALRRDWQYVRVVSMTYGSARLRAILDDYACYVFGRR